MAKKEWLYCNDDWFDLINIIKMEKNSNKRLCEFNEMLKRDEMTVENVIDEWSVIEKSDIENCVNEWFYDYNLANAVTLGGLTYWFFNIYTGETLHIKCSVNISFSDIIID
jgi:hypothetical protein